MPQISIEKFDALPNQAFVNVETVATLLDVSIGTVWRGVKSGKIPKPKHLTSRTTRWSVGELRQAFGLTCGGA